jgi:hypothetical protein
MGPSVLACKDKLQRKYRTIVRCGNCDVGMMIVALCISVEGIVHMSSVTPNFLVL